MAVIAVLFMEVSMSLIARKSGAHLAVAVGRWAQRLPVLGMERILNPIVVFGRWDVWIVRLNRIVRRFPLGTFTANILGTCVGMSYDLHHSSAARGVVGCQVLQGIKDGFCGALTTVSTWVLELDTLRLRHAYFYGACSLFVATGLITTIMGSIVTDVLGPKIIEAKLDPAKDLKKIDQLMIDTDGTLDKSKLGANAILCISMAAARARAAARDMPLYQYLAAESGTPSQDFVLPVPFMNEFMIAPTHATFFTQAVQWNAETYSSLKKLIESKHSKGAIGLGDERGFAPPIHHPHEALDLLMEAIQDASHEGKIKIGIDPASQSFFKDGKYDMDFKTDTPDLLEASQLGNLYHDWAAFTECNKDCAIELVGDDLLATNIERVKTGEEKKACNSMLLKTNQIGTITEAIGAGNEAFSAGWSVSVSHRSGETTDDFILKSGAPARGERAAKYNRLMDIEDELSAKGLNRYAGEKFRDAHKDL
ncbi:hypothetical protein LTR08_002739 [Meristemomyces frigidus]|nr:hypothetical protein LTR08_002739 [Meristemomyces frigidus]